MVYICKNNMEVKECLKLLYSQLPFDKAVEADIFYEFISKKFEAFVNTLNQIDVESLEKILKSEFSVEHFVGSCTKLRFIHCMEKICKDWLNILALCYKGNLMEANIALKNVLHSRCYSKYLVENYIEHFSFNLERRDYYRMRDEKVRDKEGNEIKVENCWHVPYDKRMSAPIGRYNLWGYPCLYLGDCKETCNAELAELKEDERRWVGTFNMKKSILLYDLRIPTPEIIEKAEKYDLFRMLLTYPVIALCSSQSNGKGFNEEYFIPQLLFHQILIAGNKETSHKGIVYSSTKNKGGYNIVLPALYDELEPPKSEYSEILKDMLEQQRVEIYKN